jgi:hypothetical protein
MIRIKQGRNKESALRVDIDLPFPFEEVKLEICALPKAWKTLYILSQIAPERIAKNININSISEAVFNKIEAKPGRGPHRGREDFVRKIKGIATYIYYWTDYWLKKHPNEWPNSLKEIIKEGRDQIIKERSHYGKPEKLKPSRVTAYIMEKYYGKEREKHDLSPWMDDPDAFRRTFIASDEYTKYIKTKSQELIEKGIFGTDPPL